MHFYPHLINCLEIWRHTYKKSIEIIFSKHIDFSSTKLCIDHRLLKIKLIYMHGIDYKTCSPCIYKHYKIITKQKLINKYFLFHTTL